MLTAAGATETIRRISLWSGPRNVSTALMYSFARRADTAVFDEPLYAHYLTRSPARNYHPGAEEVIASMEADAGRVLREVLFGSHRKKVLFFNNMAHHLVEMEWDFLLRLENVLLTRDPAEMLPSYAHQVESPTLTDTGYAKQCRILDYLESMGKPPAVLDSRQLLLNPERVLGELCSRLKIPFDRAMLQWEPGPRPEDGVWAKYWYGNVHRSRGFQPFRPKSRPFPAHLEALLEECRPYYARLRERAIEA